MRDFIHSLPKAELHAHLNGSIPRRYLRYLLSHSRRWSNADKRLLQTVHLGIEDCFKIFELIHTVISSREILYQITKEVIHSFCADHVTYLELRTGPKSIPEKGFTFHRYVETILQATDDAEKECNYRISVRWILSINREKSIENAHQILQLLQDIDPQKERIVGLDFSGNPRISHFTSYQPIFEKAKELGLGTAIHFAEIWNSQDTDAILDFSPDRLGHGCCLAPHQWDRLLEQRIPVEICATSNLMLGAFEVYNHHPVSAYILSEHPICISTDDKGIFGNELSDELLHLARHLNLSEEKITHLSKMSFQYAFSTLPDHLISSRSTLDLRR